MFDYDTPSDMDGDIYSLTGYAADAAEEMFDEVMDALHAENEYFDDGFLDSLDADY